MRGEVDPQGEFFYTIQLEEMVPADHPLRAIKQRVDRILLLMDPAFGQAYGSTGRPSVPPERLLKAMVIQALYSIPSDIKLMEAIEFNLLYRWFVDLPVSERAWTPEVFSMNRRRFEQHQLVRRFFELVVNDACIDGLISTDHFTVDGSLIRAHASMKSVQPINKEKDEDDDGDEPPSRDPIVSWRGEKRSNKTHRSTTDPQARIMKKAAGKEAHLSHAVHVLMENRHGLIVEFSVSEAHGRAECEEAIAMVDRAQKCFGIHVRTLGADRGYDRGDFLLDLERRFIEPHVAATSQTRDPRWRRGSDDRQRVEARERNRKRCSQTHYQRSQVVRKRVEEIFGWCKTVGRMARTRFRERWRIHQEQLITASAYNLIRLRNLMA